METVAKATRKVVLSGGREIVFSAAPAFVIYKHQQRWDEKHPPPEPPTKKVETIESKRLGAEPDEKPLKEGPEWEKWGEDYEDWKFERLMNIQAPVIVFGLKDHYPLPEDDSWLEDLKMLPDIEVPDKKANPIEYYYLYYQVTMLPSAQDIIQVANEISALSVPSEARIAEKMRDFPLSGRGNFLTRFLSRRFQRNSKAKPSTKAPFGSGS